MCVWRTLTDPPNSEQKVHVEENGKSCWISRGESDHEGPQKPGMDLHLIGVGGGEMKAVFKEQSSGVHVQDRLE